MGQRSKTNTELAGSAAAAATFSSVTTAMFLFTVVTATSPALGWQLAPACAAAAIVAGACGGLMLWHAKRPNGDEVELGRPVSLKAALLFAAVVTGVLIVSALLSRWLGAGAAIASVAVSGFADAHSGSISAAMLHRNEGLEAGAAQIAVLLAFSTNAITKIVVSFVTGTRGYAARICVGVVASVAAAWFAWLVAGLDS